MKRTPSVDEARISAINARERTAWFQSSQIKRCTKNYTTTDNSFQQACRIRASLVLAASRVISPEDAELQTKRPGNIVNYVDSSIVQAVISVGQRVSRTPEIFSQRIYDFFSKNNQDVEFFARLAFPSLYGFFIEPGLTKNAFATVKALINLECPEIYQFFVVSLFENTPNFIERLITTYKMKIARLKTSAPFRYFDCFIESLRVAVQCLSADHFEITSMILEKNTAMFREIFVKRLFMAYFGFLDPGSPLMKVFEYLIANNPVTTMEVLKSLLKSPRFVFESELTVLGGLPVIDISPCHMILSPYELFILANILEPLIVARLFHKIEAEEWSDMDGCLLGLFFNTNGEKPKTTHQIFPLGKCPKFKREKESFLRTFTALEHTARDMSIDLIAFFDPSLVWECNRRPIERLVEMTSLLRSPDFRMYCYSKMLAESYDTLIMIDNVLSWCECDRMLSELTDRVNSFNETIRDWVAGVVDFERPEMQVRSKFIRFSIEDETSANELNEICDTLLVEMRKSPRNLKSRVSVVHDEILRVRCLPVGARALELARIIDWSLKRFGPNEIGEIIWNSIPEAMDREMVETFCVYLKYFDSIVAQCSDSLQKMILRSWNMIYSALADKLIPTKELKVKLDQYTSRA